MEKSKKNNATLKSKMLTNSPEKSHQDHPRTNKNKQKIWKILKKSRKMNQKYVKLPK